VRLAGVGILVGQELHVTQVGQGARLGELIAGVMGGLQGGVVQRHGLVPVALAAQELVHRGRDRGSVPWPAAGRCVTDRGVQVEAFGTEP